MRRRIIIASLAVFAVLIGLLVLPEVFSREPRYHGKRLSDWFKQYYRSGHSNRQPDEGAHARAARALKAIGTNAVPYLVTQCLATNQDSPWQTNLLTFLADLPKPIRF